MATETAEDALAQIRRLLDDRVGFEGAQDLSTAQRVEDVIRGFEMWCDLAISRLHEIHRLTNNECEACARYLDQEQPRT